MGYTIDIDTGGTFTDGFFVNGERVEMVKVSTTPHDLTVCFLKCIEAGAERFGVAVEDLLYETDIIRFSNTIGTNTIIQRDGSKIGLLVTAGTEALAPTQAEDGHEPLVRPDMVLAVSEGVDEAGRITTETDAGAVMAAAQTLIDRGARCLVVVFANAEQNPANERLVRKIVKREYPNDFLGSVPVFLSSDISSRSGLAERMNTAVLNAYIHAKLVRLLYKAGEELRKRLYHKNLFIVHNNGAVARVAKTRAINTYNSGPAAGLLGARLIGEYYGVGDLISADMGGTSFDIGYVKNGEASYMLRPDVEGFAVNVPMLAIRAIGAGGGSIASVRDGVLQVGPQSAGALPGPVCFDLGGNRPTVADADVVLGILDPDYFLGGAMKLNVQKAYAVIAESIAKPLNITVEEAARRIKATVDRAMGEELGQVKDTVFSQTAPLMVCYGGAGPAHCCDIARIAGIRKIVVTPFSSVFSAFSSSNMDVGHLYYRRVNMLLAPGSDATEVLTALEDMAGEAARDMRGEGFSMDHVENDIDVFVTIGDGPEFKVKAQKGVFENSARMSGFLTAARACAQGGNVNLDGGRVVPAADACPAGDDARLRLTTASLMARAKVAHYDIRKTPAAVSPVEAAMKGSRRIYMGSDTGTVPVPVYDRTKLENGHGLAGPVVVESEHTTLFVPAGWHLGVDHLNNVVIEEA